MQRELKSTLTFLLLLVVSTIYGQHRSISPTQISTTINLDGVLDESVWTTTETATDFHMHYPYDSIQASSQTEVKMLFDKSYLYVGAICKNNKPTDYVIQSLKRDFDFRENESFVVFLDLFNDGTGGMAFGVNPKGVQRDGIIPRGGTKGVQLNWDGKWLAEVHQSPDKTYWSIEMAIPLKTLRFSKNNFTWGVNFARNDLNNNEVSTWSPVTRSFEVATLAQAGKINWQTLPSPQNSKITLVPYSAVTSEKSYEKQTDPTLKSKIGLDAKIALTSSLNLDFTINPDFSQVEVDQQVIDLNRFELFFPEKRLLFLENSDLFSGLGNSRVRPYFSRRIGSAGSDPVQIHFGARLSGKVSKKLQIGLMTAQTDAVEGLGQNGQNYSIAAVQRAVLGGSSITAFISNRQSTNSIYLDHNNYNRIGGLEFDFRSKNSLWSGKSFLHYSFSDSVNNNGLAYNAKLRYKSKASSLFFGIDGVKENYITEMGYVPRLRHEYNDSIFRIPYNQIRSNGYHRFFSNNKNSKIDFWSVRFDANIFADQNDFSYQEHEVGLSFILRFLNASELELKATHFSPKLFFPFTLNGLEFPFYVGNYPNRRFIVNFDSGKLRRFHWSGHLGFGGEYMGNRFDFKGEANYRFKHFIAGGLTFSQQNLSVFPDVYGNAAFTLIGSKFEISFNRNLFLLLSFNTILNQIILISTVVLIGDSNQCQIYILFILKIIVRIISCKRPSLGIEIKLLVRFIIDIPKPQFHISFLIINFLAENYYPILFYKLYFCAHAIRIFIKKLKMKNIKPIHILTLLLIFFSSCKSQQKTAEKSNPVNEEITLTCAMESCTGQLFLFQFDGYTFILNQTSTPDSNNIYTFKSTCFRT